MATAILPLLGVSLLSGTEPTLTLVRDGQTPYTIMVLPTATAAEQRAAAELASFLEQVSGAAFTLSPTRPAGPAILVGPGPHLRAAGVREDLDTWGPDELLIRTHGRDLVLAGGRPRGTLYAVYTFLEDIVGCRWWSSTVSTVPSRRSLSVPPTDRREKPPFEYREPFYYDAFDPEWAVRNKTNGHRANLGEEHGGHITYAGFVHTFSLFVPPEKHFTEHPEWFSEIDGERVAERSQLCLTNDGLKAFVAQRVVDRLTETPSAGIVSVSQNDWGNPCQCAKCAALAELEEAQSGPLLHFVNDVAERVEKVFPKAAISTLAYQYTRKPPRYVRPRHNVIVRLCSIECNFAEPLARGQTNAAFREDIEAWGGISERLYVWDYVTNFSHYIQPHPNLRVLGPNVRFFAGNKVKGLFEQGNYHSPGGEFAELRAWVLAKLMWNPERNARELIAEFLSGYYGAAAPHIQAYVDLMHDEVERSGHFLTYASSPSAPFLTLESLTRAHEALRAAEAAVADQPEVLERVRVCRLPLQYVWIAQWDRLRTEAKARGLRWPVDEKRDEVLGSFRNVAKENGITFIREAKRLASFPEQQTAIPRRAAEAPAACRELPDSAWIDLQDNVFTLYGAGKYATLKPDTKASDGAAAWMPGDHHEWATQCETSEAGLGGLPGRPYTSYAVIRCEATGREGSAFCFGLYDVATRTIVARKFVSAAEVADDEFHVYPIGTFRMHTAMYLWVAPARNMENVASVSVDRFFLVGPVAESAAKLEGRRLKQGGNGLGP